MTHTHDADGQAFELPPPSWAAGTEEVSWSLCLDFFNFIVVQVLEVV